VCRLFAPVVLGRLAPVYPRAGHMRMIAPRELRRQGTLTTETAPPSGPDVSTSAP
jgi:hypothetical protein